MVVTVAGNGGSWGMYRDRSLNLIWYKFGEGSNGLEDRGSELIRHAERTVLPIQQERTTAPISTTMPETREGR